ncbi:MAG: hypothetical protein NWS78_02905, partial [Gammaproteobacteria bacterium]|nr:hypothetical protein [Gammaproteobacteria bacterium]MDP5073625.1 hypothetical protein [OM182 bacterium]
KINKDGYSPDSKGRKLAFQEKADSELFALLHPTTLPDNSTRQPHPTMRTLRHHEQPKPD